MFKDCSATVKEQNLQYILDKKSSSCLSVAGVKQNSVDDRMIEATADCLNRPIIIVQQCTQYPLPLFRLTKKGSRSKMPIFVLYDGFHYCGIVPKMLNL
jgi:hypothetical protein